MSHHGDVAQHNDTVALTHLTEGLGCHLPRNLSKPPHLRQCNLGGNDGPQSGQSLGDANSRSVAIRRRAAKDWPRIPLSAMLLGSFTNTGSSQPAGAAPHFEANNNFALDQISIFFAGRVTDFAGAFVQGTYSGVDKRSCSTTPICGLPRHFPSLIRHCAFGTSINNGPTVQDPFNSTPVWMFPFASSALAPTPTAQTLLGGRQLVGNSLGITAYGWYDRSLYLEAGGYETYGPTLLSWTGNALGPGSTAISPPMSVQLTSGCGTAKRRMSVRYC